MPDPSHLSRNRFRSRLRWVALFSLVAGSCDTATGILLVSSPALALQWMGIRDLGPEPLCAGHAMADVQLRYLGMFVGSIGLSYLYPWLFVRDRIHLLTSAGPEPDRRWLERLSVVFEVTCLVRLAVALFVTVATAMGALSAPWLSIAATDLTFALCQIQMLHHGWLASDRIDRERIDRERIDRERVVAQGLDTEQLSEIKR